MKSKTNSVDDSGVNSGVTAVERLRRYSCGTNSGVTDEVAAAEILISFQFQSQFQRCAPQHSADQAYGLGVGSRTTALQRYDVIAAFQKHSDDWYVATPVH